MHTKTSPSQDAPTMLRPSSHLLSPAALDFGATIVGVGPEFPRPSVSVPPSAACKQPSWIQPEDFDPDEWPSADEPSEVPPPTLSEAERAKTNQFDARAYWDMMEFDTLDRLAPVSALVRSVHDPEETVSVDVDLEELEVAAPAKPVAAKPVAAKPVAAKKVPTDIVPLATPLPRSKSLPSIPPEGIDRCTWNPSGRTARPSRFLLVAVVLMMLAAGGAALLQG